MNWKADDAAFLLTTIVIVVFFSLAAILGCFFWFRREHRRLQKRVLEMMRKEAAVPDEVFVSSVDVASCGELVAQFKVNRGKQVVSLMESDGRRFLHVEGELSGVERARMVRYLKSEGFMS